MEGSQRDLQGWGSKFALPSLSALRDRADGRGAVGLRAFCECKGCKKGCNPYKKAWSACPPHCQCSWTRLSALVPLPLALLASWLPKQVQ